MGNETVKWIVFAALLIAAGLILIGGVMLAVDWDVEKLPTVQYERNRYEIDDRYGDIAIASDTADIMFRPSEDGKTSIICYEQERAKHAVGVEDGTLLIELVDTRKWHERIISFGKPAITVYLPTGDYARLSVKESTGNIEIPASFSFESVEIEASTGDITCSAFVSGCLKIKTSTGDISVRDISAGVLDLAVSTGKVSVSNVKCDGDVEVRVSTGKAQLSDLTCKSVVSTGNTGAIFFTNVIVDGKLSVERSTGDVRFDGADAAELFVVTDTGDVKGTLLSEKVFITRSDTGRIDVPDSVSGGRCEITTDTGNIKIEIRR